MFKAREPGVFQNWLSLTLLVALLCVVAPLGFPLCGRAVARLLGVLSGASVTSGLLWLLHR